MYGIVGGRSPGCFFWVLRFYLKIEAFHFHSQTNTKYYTRVVRH